MSEHDASSEPTDPLTARQAAQRRLRKERAAQRIAEQRAFAAALREEAMAARAARSVPRQTPAASEGDPIERRRRALVEARRRGAREAERARLQASQHAATPSSPDEAPRWTLGDGALE